MKIEYIESELKKNLIIEENETKITDYQITDFDSLYFSFVYDQFSKEEVMDMQLVLSVYSKALIECKKNNVAKAQIYYNKAENYLQKIKLNNKQKQYLNVYRYPNIAFMYYKIANYETSKFYLRNSIKCIEKIQRDYEPIHLAKIQQIHNFIRVYHRQNFFHEYFTLNSQIINFFLFYDVPGDNSFKLNPILLSKSNNNHVEALFYQILSEFVLSGITNKKIAPKFSVLINKIIERKDKIISGRFKFFIFFITFIESVNKKNNSEIKPKHIKEIFVLNEEYIFLKIYSCIFLAKRLKREGKIYYKNSIDYCIIFLNKLLRKCHDEKILIKIKKEIERI